MPELPEVETIVRELNVSSVIGSTIKCAKVLWPRSIATPDVATFCKRIVGQKILKVSRRGKWIVIHLSKDFLLIHLRMTGKFTIVDAAEPNLKHDRVQIFLNSGFKLCYEDQRKFGKWYLVESTSDYLDELGLEPLEKTFTLAKFKAVLSGKDQKAKPFLLSQNHISGLGNIYVDEALWEAKIHPKRIISSLSEREILDLFKAIPKVLKKGIENSGTTLGSSRANYFSVSGRRGGNQHKLSVFRREGLGCPRCGTIIKKIVVSQRGTHFCPKCQKIVQN